MVIWVLHANRILFPKRVGCGVLVASGIGAYSLQAVSFKVFMSFVAGLRSNEACIMPAQFRDVVAGSLA